MYIYKFHKSKENLNKYMKVYRVGSSIIPAITGFVVNILLFTMCWILIINKYNIISFTAYSIVILITMFIQIVVFIFYTRKLLKREIDNLKESNLHISFKESGIIFQSESSIKEIKWDAIKGISVYRDYFILRNSCSFMKENIMIFFNGFSVPSKEIIEEMKKYKNLTILRRDDCEV